MSSEIVHDNDQLFLLRSFRPSHLEPHDTSSGCG